MLAMSIFRNIILNLSKPSHNNCPSIVILRPKVSRVFFTSTSKYPEGRNADDRNSNSYDADEAVPEPPDDVKMTMDRSNEKSRIMKEKTNAAKELANERAHVKTKENMGSVAAKAQEMKDKAMGSAETMADRTKESMEVMADKAKETVEGVWGAAKGTTKKVKEAVVGKSGDGGGDLEDYVKDYEKKVERDKKNKY
ncbi:hypothetical protein CASFOL_039522 [Castilleja foliolosa]|uniref:Uncharacterized protein n=1 Tax=Castilleja foliolosa TaxID=1961234 RepID=A0ABD3BI67_9LAMI